jgi:hypothetical protein
VTVGFICHGQQTGTKEKGIVIQSIFFQNDQVGYPSRNFLAGMIGEGDTMPFSLQSWVWTKSIGVTLVRVQFKDGHPNILCTTCSPQQHPGLWRPTCDTKSSNHDCVMDLSAECDACMYELNRTRVRRFLACCGCRLGSDQKESPAGQQPNCNSIAHRGVIGTSTWSQMVASRNK